MPSYGSSTALGTISRRHPVAWKAPTPLTGGLVPQPPTTMQGRMASITRCSVYSPRWGRRARSWAWLQDHQHRRRNLRPMKGALRNARLRSAPASDNVSDAKRHSRCTARSAPMQVGNVLPNRFRTPRVPRNRRSSIKDDARRSISVNPWPRINDRPQPPWSHLPRSTGSKAVDSVAVRPPTWK